MADKKIKIEVDLDAEPSIAQLKKLKLALKETTAGSDDWNKYKNAINDTEDALKSAGKGADNFAEIIGTLPGPLGDLGNKLGSTVNTLKIFGGIKLDALKNSFTELGKDIGQAGSSILKITGIQKLYTITTVAMSKALRFVGIEATAASFGVKAFSAALVATGIGAIVVGLGLLISAFMNAGDEADVTANKVAKLNKEFDKLRTDAKLNANETIARLNAEGATQETIAAAKKKIIQDELNLARNAFDQYQTQMTAAEIMDEKGSEGYKKALEGRKQAEKDIKQLKSDLRIADYNEQERLRKESEKEIKPAKEDPAVKAKEEALKLIAKNEKEAALSLLDDREQAKRKIVNDYNAQIKLAADNGKETFILEEAKLKALRELKDKYQKEDDEKAEEIKAKEREAAFETLQNQIDDLTAQNDLIDDDFAQDLERLENKRILLDEQKTIELSNLKLTEAERIKIIAKYAKQEQDIDKSVTATKKAEKEAKLQLQSQYADAIGRFGSILQQAAGENKKLAIAGLLIEQGAGIAKIIINSQAAASKAGYLSPKGILELISGGLGVAAAVIATKKGIDQINKVNIPGGGSGGGGDSSAQAPLPAYNSGMAMNTPQINTTGGANPATQISQTIQNAQSVPIKAYVVSGEIASQQQLDRRANRGATFNLG